MPRRARPASGIPPHLDTAALREWLASPDGPRLLDVRTAAEFTTAHIPGSYNVPLDLLREHRDELRTHLQEDVVLDLPLRGPRRSGRDGPRRRRP